MLTDAGFNPRRVLITLDDDTLAEAVEGVESTCLARAWFKACAAQHALLEQVSHPGEAAGVLLAADTLCESEGRLLGKPTCDAEAKTMIRHLSGRVHRTVTGVALQDLSDDRRCIWTDSTIVKVGALTEEQIQHYIASGEWRGKSGGYNLVDRINAGWSIEIEGDPDTVMGLPMRRLRPLLQDMLSGEAS